MKHFLIYALAAVLLVTLIGHFAAAKTVDPDLTAPLERTAVVAVQAQDGSEAAEPSVVMLGLLQAEMSSMDDVYFRNSLKESLGDSFEVHCLETPENGSDQMAMFQKMVDKGYQVIVVQLFDQDMAEEYIDIALEKGITLVFTGLQPPQEQMSRMENLYYVGYSSSNTMRQLADAIIMGWENNQSNLDLKPDDRLVYGVFTKDDYTENGNEEALNSYLSAAGIEAELGLNAITQAYNFDLRSEVDDILYAGGEMIICDSSSYARQISNYLLDPTEFTEQLQKTRIYLTVADEAALEMVREGTAMFACGASGNDLGRTVALLVQSLVKGEQPTEEAIGATITQNKCVYVTSQTVTADLLSEKAPEDEAE